MFHFRSSRAVPGSVSYMLGINVHLGENEAGVTDLDWHADMRGILLSTTPGCVRGPRCVEPKVGNLYTICSVLPTDYRETTPSMSTREAWHVLLYGWTEVQGRVYVPCVCCVWYSPLSHFAENQARQETACCPRLSPWTLSGYRKPKMDRVWKKVHKWKLELLEPLSKSDTKRIPGQEIPTQRQLSTTDSFFRGDTNKGKIGEKKG